MRTRGLVIALSISLASCNIYFDEGSGSSNHKHHQGPDGGPAEPDAFPGWGVDAGWWGTPDAFESGPPDADFQTDAGFQTPDADFQNDAAPDASTCPTPDAATPDAHTCGC